MLQNTFVHLPGIGLKTELSFWREGIHSWESFSDEHAWSRARFSQRRYKALRVHLDLSRERLHAGDPAYFADALTPKLLWRLFADFRECAAYLDIETTGLGGPYDHITTAALYDGRKVAYYVYGDNLDLFAGDLRKYKVLITYNGACFDLPFIRSYFGIAVDQVHIDLRYLLSSLGYRGGLKGCEKCLGLDRAELDGVDGYFAVLLWNEYRKSGNKNALETLLAYNIADTVNLENLMVQAFNMKVAETPFCDLKIPLPRPPTAPFEPDVELIEMLRQRYYIF
jgi:uncharacterized protein